MDLGFTHASWHETCRGKAGQGAISVDGGSSLDWHALRARLHAARAARNELRAPAGAAPHAAEASFDAGVARQLRGDAQCFTPVNPVSLTVRKTGLGIVAAFVGETSSGDRG